MRIGEKRPGAALTSFPARSPCGALAGQATEEAGVADRETARVVAALADQPRRAASGRVEARHRLALRAQRFARRRHRETAEREGAEERALRAAIERRVGGRLQRPQ